MAARVGKRIAAASSPPRPVVDGGVGIVSSQGHLGSANGAPIIATEMKRRKQGQVQEGGEEIREELGISRNSARRQPTRNRHLARFRNRPRRGPGLPSAIEVKIRRLAAAGNAARLDEVVALRSPARAQRHPRGSTTARLARTSTRDGAGTGHCARDRSVDADKGAALR